MQPADSNPIVDGMEPIKDAPLPATLAFVLSIGSFILVGWIAMFFLLRARW